ncbi:cathepsin L-like peptidase [Parasteatoda tepidariorum]|uniref:cathepsin L-like peptidase n=1 Tax=Parasteatoda tepidariorum TaxID=114398 RepID=UPI001C7206E0|nr:procathepsin L-like [Parasteatoda tepidariorum]
MKFVVIFVVAAISSAHCLSFGPQLDDHWELFKKVYGKRYEHPEEFSRRLIWEKAVSDIVQHNLLADLGIYTYRKGINEYTDMSHEEFVKNFIGFSNIGQRSKNGSNWISPSNDPIPDTVDWRKQGLVTPIRDQKECSSGYAFSVTGSLEGQQKKKTGNLVALSAQNIIDCSKPEGNGGCNGGFVDQSFLYIKLNRGIDTEASYPYTARDGPECLFKKEDVGATIEGYVDLPSGGDEETLKKAVATVGPISVAIDASNLSFMNYKSGIYYEPACNSDYVNHAVLAIGYGTEDGIDYWLVKNCWGTTWGIKGYIKMARNKNNNCGIASSASYPLV